MMLVLAIAIGGAMGSVARHFVIASTNAAWPNFPYGTLMVNVIGSFVIGALMEIMAQRWQVSQEIRAFLVTGFLGGFTTFSAFSFDVLKLVDTNQYVPAFLYVASSLLLSLAAVFGAVFIFRGVFS